VVCGARVEEGGLRPRSGLAAYRQTQVRAVRTMGTLCVARGQTLRTGARAKGGQAAHLNS